MIRKLTKPLRFKVVKTLAPKLYQEWEEVHVDYLPRGMVKTLKEKFGDRPLVGVEIGVKYGYHARSMLEYLNVERLYLVDPYLKDLRPLIKAKNYLWSHHELINWVLKKSEDSTDDIPDGLDFVYIDGDHSYEYVKKDIDAFYPKVKKGGFLGGHDFNPLRDYGVVKAVLEFIHNNNLRLYIKRPCDWFIVK